MSKTIFITIEVPDDLEVQVKPASFVVPVDSDPTLIKYPTPAQIEDGEPLPPWPGSSVPAEPVHVEAAPQAPPGGHHGQSWRYVPGGVSKRTGKAYTGFWACAEAGCNEKPPR